MNANLNLDTLIDRLPEPELWRLLQDVIASELELQDRTIQRLDDRMQGFLFLQEYVTNREARIAFARSHRHMPYLRAAAGSHNVWMSDAEFTELVEENDSTTLACFARSEQMRPHHLAYIEQQLARHPHGNDVLATSYDASITLKKSLEQQGGTREMALFKLAQAALEGSPEVSTLLESQIPDAVPAAGADTRVLWRVYLNLAGLDENTLRELLEAAGESSMRPFRTSRGAIHSLH
jgi:hypothetical protein